MSITRCPVCNKNIDEDYDVEHFDECEQNGVTAREIILEKSSKTNNQMKQNSIKIELPKTWHYNEESLRMERTIQVRDENDELIGYHEHCAVVPQDIVDFVSEELTTLIDKVREETLRDFAEYADLKEEIVWNKPTFIRDWAESYLQSIKE